MPVRPDRLEPEDFPVPFGRYTLLGLLGEGGMARVFEAELVGHEGFRKRAALKVIRSGIGRSEARLRKALIKEARLGGLLHHPNVVETYDFGETNGQAWIAMEIVRGMGLDQLLAEGQPLPPSIALEVAAQICQGLEHAHNLRDGDEPAPLVHRDLKPSNVMVAHSGLVKVLDFGIAKATHIAGHTTETGMTKGTPAYMSPEQAAGDPVDARSDLFALGCIIFELVTGRRFFRGDTVYAIMLQVIKVDDLVADPETFAPAEARAPGISAILRKCLTRDASLRWTEARELERELRNLQGRLPLPGPIRDWLEAREEAFKARTAELEALSLDATPRAGGLQRPRRIEELGATRPQSTGAPVAAGGAGEPASQALAGSSNPAPAPTVRMAPSPATPPAMAKPPGPVSTRTMQPRAVVSSNRRNVWMLAGAAALLMVVALVALTRPGDAPEEEAVVEPTPEAPALGDSLIAPPIDPEEVPDATPEAPEATPPPQPAPEVTPEPVAAPSPRPDPTPAPTRRPEPAPKPAGRIVHTAPEQAVVGAPNRLTAQIVDADCTPAVLYGPWSASDGALRAKVMQELGDGHFEADLFIPYELDWRKGYRYVIRCGSKGEDEIRWPRGGAQRVDALAR